MARLLEKAWKVVREEGALVLFRLALLRFAPSLIDRLGNRVERRGNRVSFKGLQFDVSHSSISRRVKGLLAMGLYERPEQALINRFLPKDMPVIELGGCIGVVSCAINRRLVTPQNHVVVEANPDLIPVIMRHKQANGCRFSVEGAVLAYGQESATFYVNDSIQSSSAQAKTGHSIIVPSCNVRTLGEQHGFTSFSLVCDIEGGEADLVSVEGDFLARSVRVLIMEMHPQVIGVPATDALHKRLQTLGFQLQSKIENVYCYRNVRAS